MIEGDGYVTLHPYVSDRAALVDETVAFAVTRAMEHGMQPLCVRVSVASYRALLSRDGLAPPNIAATGCTQLRALVVGFDLPVHCDRSVPDDGAHVSACLLNFGRA